MYTYYIYTVYNVIKHSRAGSHSFTKEIASGKNAAFALTCLNLNTRFACPLGSLQHEEKHRAAMKTYFRWDNLKNR